MSASEIETWISSGLSREKLSDCQINIAGRSEQGDGFFSDIIFLNVVGKNGNQEKKYDLVLKCAKKGKTLRDTAPVEDCFKNEINIYNYILPEFQKFQLQKSVSIFDSFPKSYGYYVDDNMEVLIFQNLKKLGYVLHDKTKPLSKEHIHLVLEEYGKLHATSLAIQDQLPQKFQEIARSTRKIFQLKNEGTVKMFKKCSEEIIDLLKSDIDSEIIEAWKKYCGKIRNILEETEEYAFDDSVKTVTHGDCWNNNFMFHYADAAHKIPDKLAILDWQISALRSPISDISYFLFACISSEEGDNLNSYLDFYYKSLTEYAEKLGSDMNHIWPKTNFLKDWKKFGSYGLIFIPIVAKVCLYQKDEIPDLAESAEKSDNFLSCFTTEIKEKEAFKNRMKFIVELAYEHGIVHM